MATALIQAISALTSVKVTAPLLIAILYYPQRLHDVLPTLLQPWAASPALVRTLALLVSLSVLRRANRQLSRRVVNNAQSVRFVPSEELVLITGGSSGIGLGMARDFAARGVKVVVMDLSPPREEFPSNVYFYESDVTSPAKIAATAAEIRRDHGDPTVLINNAGIGTLMSILEGSERSIQKTFEVNTISHFWMVREFLPKMIERDHGHVVTISSMASLVVLANNVDYSCTKASAVAFHEGLHSELRNKYNAPRVRITLVSPNWIRTPMIAPMLESPDWKSPVLEPEEVIAAVVNQVMSAESGHLILPKRLSMLSAIRGWPSWLQYGLRNSEGRKMEQMKIPTDLKLATFQQGKN